MIDTLSILFSTVMVLFIALRAIRLDRATSWFGGQRGQPGSPDSKVPRGA